MTISYDPAVDALYARLADGEIETTEEELPSCLVSYAEDGRVLALQLIAVGATLKHFATSEQPVLIECGIFKTLEELRAGSAKPTMGAAA